MKKFIDTVNKKELLVSEELYHVDNFIDKLECEGIHVVSNIELADYTDSLEDITDAFLEIVDDLEEERNYFRLPTQEELMQKWVDSGWKDMGEPFDKELATSFYYSDCVMEAINEDAYDFLEWLDSKNRFFTYVTVNRIYDTGFYDLIEYHPLTNLENDLLVDKDNLEKEFFDEWYTIEDEEGNVKEFSLDNSNMLDRYMFEKYNAIEVTK
ncbi:hypothetical protein A8C46_00475 [Ligilactobacillus salivarius]|uniref:hypothetical protein n=1 Tax=Ligilactobacillus salivarius TaxID=1624 RepID=UPI000A2DC4F5|nr:hypothetical protein [Ligilactobacillus salivarius]OTF89729.1 hypothetical protein A8C38_00165 [Ligilactobacillus salivarius]PAY43564.1 hypothetical protein A8C39_00345 [Ligilactobacillus salivarius]PAY49378.1 hypothetical protein A8C42_00495 [Ligilactobacillus salivarius]PAY58076.1 hypothetical protein A8C46_00475 [Ligilactobacillus salivarius]PAY58747.1 hypothetical protein A8C40_01375 [Ligilactobacillus salivarius]